MKINDAIPILENCEKGLRKLVAEAAAEGKYSELLKITEWAKTISLVLSNATNETTKTSVKTAADNLSPSKRQPTSIRRIKRYPIFFRHGSELIKVGWSKKYRTEYNHRAPKEVINTLAKLVQEIGGKGKVFTGDRLLPMKNNNNGTWPDYQVYLSLAWLKELGLLEQRGRRGGYKIAPQKNIEATIDSGWLQLQEWEG